MKLTWGQRLYLALRHFADYLTYMGLTTDTPDREASAIMMQGIKLAVYEFILPEHSLVWLNTYPSQR